MGAIRDRLRSDWVGGAIGSALTIGLGLALHTFRFGQGLVVESYDLLFIPRPPIPVSEAVIVQMDEDSHAELGQPLNAAWDRALHARLVDRLREAGAKTVVFDIVFSDANTNARAGDEALAQAIARSGRVVLAAEEVLTAEDETLVRAKRVIPPIPEFADHAELGVTELAPHQDLIVRRHLQASVDDQLPSLSWAAAARAGAPVTVLQANRFRERWINYYGPPGAIPSVSYHRALSGEGVAPGLFRGRTVFIGSRLKTRFAGQRKDEFATPYSFWMPGRPFMPGVEIHATAHLNLVRGDWLERLPSEALVLVLAGLLLGFGLAPLRALAACGVALTAAVCVAGGAYAQFTTTRIWFAWLIVVAAQVPMALASSIVYNWLRLYVRNRLLEQSLALYLSPKRVKQFVRRPDLLRPGAEKQELSIIFTDIENFTAIAEGMDSDDLAQLMNRYFEQAISQCIHKTDGTVVKYIGDAIFAFWNAPELQEDHRYRACQAALLMRDQVLTFSKNETTWTMRTRIGLHTGVANVGNFGSATRIDYTAIGESINLASRMEGLNKYLGTNILATRETLSGAADRVVSRFLGRFRLKGFERAVEVHELVGGLEHNETTSDWREAFARALDAFTRQAFGEARAGFERVLELRPTDGPSRFYLAQLEELRLRPPPQGWTGDIEMKEK
jgi:adenylate cyclase